MVLMDKFRSVLSVHLHPPESGYVFGEMQSKTARKTAVSPFARHRRPAIDATGIPTKRGSAMDVKKILWPTDFSRNAEAALPQVKSLTEKYGAEIHVLYVIEDTAHHEPWYGVFDEERVGKLMDHARKTAEDRLEKICSKYLEGCPLYIRHIAVGDPAAEILAFVEKEKVDLVVMATRGQKPRFPFGSVTEKVVKHSPVPVTTVPVPRKEADEEAA